MPSPACHHMHVFLTLQFPVIDVHEQQIPRAITRVVLNCSVEIPGDITRQQHRHGKQMPTTSLIYPKLQTCSKHKLSDHPGSENTLSHKAHIKVLDDITLKSRHSVAHSGHFHFTAMNTNGSKKSCHDAAENAAFMEPAQSTNALAQSTSDL